MHLECVKVDWPRWWEWAGWQHTCWLTEPFAWKEEVTSRQWLFNVTTPMCVMDDVVEDGVGEGRLADQIVPTVDWHLA